jgi:hypothetical protein
MRGLRFDAGVKHEPKRARRLLLGALSVGLLSALSPALAGEPPPDFLIISHASQPNSRVSRQFLADVFLKNITRWPNDEAIRPVDQRADAAVRKHFSDRVLRRSVAAMKTYWQQRIFSGRGVPPPELEADDVVVRYVESHPGAVGYISGTAPVGKAKVLTLEP